MIQVFGIKLDILKYLNPILYVLFILVMYFLARRVINSIFNKTKRQKKMPPQQVQRIQTIHDMVNSCLKYVVLILVFLAVLAGLGVNITSIIAGLGILAAILGLACQDMIKDVISGVAIITEGQFNIGDTVEMNGFKGTVLSVGLKTTQIKRYDGQVKIISNGSISELINYSKFNIIAEVVVKTSLEADFEKVKKVLNEVQERLNGGIAGELGDVAVSMFSGLDDSGVSYKISCPCLAGDTDGVKAAIREMVLEEFKKNKIALNYPHVVVKTEK